MIHRIVVGSSLILAMAGCGGSPPPASATPAAATSEKAASDTAAEDPTVAEAKEPEPATVEAKPGPLTADFGTGEPFVVVKAFATPSMLGKSKRTIAVHDWDAPCKLSGSTKRPDNARTIMVTIPWEPGSYAFPADRGVVLHMHQNGLSRSSSTSGSKVTLESAPMDDGAKATVVFDATRTDRGKLVTIKGSVEVEVCTK